MLADHIEEFRAICREITARNNSSEVWRATESCDEFQTDHYCGGYEALEDAFCFSYYSPDQGEQRFQFTLKEVNAIAGGASAAFSLRPAE